MMKLNYSFNESKVSNENEKIFFRCPSIERDTIVLPFGIEFILAGDTMDRDKGNIAMKREEF